MALQCEYIKDNDLRCKNKIKDNSKLIIKYKKLLSGLEMMFERYNIHIRTCTSYNPNLVPVYIRTFNSAFCIDSFHCHKSYMYEEEILQLKEIIRLLEPLYICKTHRKTDTSFFNNRKNIRLIDKLTGILIVKKQVLLKELDPYNISDLNKIILKYI